MNEQTLQMIEDVEHYVKMIPDEDLKPTIDKIIETFKEEAKKRHAIKSEQLRTIEATLNTLCKMS